MLSPKGKNEISLNVVIRCDVLQHVFIHRIPPVLVFALSTPSTDFAPGHTRIIDQCPLGVKWECSQAINRQKREAHGHMFYLPSVVSLRLLMAMAGCFDLSLPVGYNSHSYSDID